MTLKKISTIFILFFSSFAFSQDLFGVSGSYSNQSGNFAKLGLFYTFGLGDTFLTPRIDANVNMAYMRDNFHVIPEIGVTGFLASSGSYIFPFVESEFTPYTITPKVGLTFMTLIDFGIGYGFSINEKDSFKPIKGFQFSAGINIPFNWN
ncbi:hypothetical protein HX096_06805 [Empedobacter falsenii]|uniref:hypothetical protein n=1 Tax=Empedobacter falsenii TaxID=343874 RepID=UPI00257644F0|nr:hypothetical protein [Empedobacter falsenii]MDM1547572.1 hypothetical protein [Empedobacter falsenii]